MCRNITKKIIFSYSPKVKDEKMHYTYSTDTHYKTEYKKMFK